MSIDAETILREAEAEIERLRRRNDRPIVRWKRMGSPELEPPRYETAGAAGMDLRADVRELRKRQRELMHGAWHISDAHVTLFSGARALIPCGFAFEIPAGCEGQVRARSGLTKKGVYAATGTLDSDYRGVVMVHLDNRSGDSIEIEHGMRIAQLVIGVAPQARLEEAEELSATTRGAGGFGSTGVR